MTIIQVENPRILRPKRIKVFARYMDGTLIKVRLKKQHHEQLMETKQYLEEASGRDFSAALVIRRALEIYSRQLERLSPEDLQGEAAILLNYFR